MITLSCSSNDKGLGPQPPITKGEWTAQSFEISEKQISVDGGKAQDIQCPHTTEKSFFATLTIAGVELEITCQDDYLQGFYAGEQMIAQFDGDAGDIWETNSTLFKDQKYQLILRKVKYSTNQEAGIADNPDELRKLGWSEEKIKEVSKVNCKTSKEYYIYKNGKFVPRDFSGNEPAQKLPAFKHYQKHCLNS